MEPFDRACFDHMGIPTTRVVPGAIFSKEEGLWWTESKLHPASIEWIRYEPNASTPLAQQPNRPHIAFRVRDIARTIEERRDEAKVLVPPSSTGLGGTFAFLKFEDGSVVELLEYADADRPGWGGHQP